MAIAASILAAVCAGPALPRLPAFLRGRRIVEIGLAYKMARAAPFAGRHRLVPDAWTGLRGVVVRIPADDPAWHGAATRSQAQRSDADIEIEIVGTMRADDSRGRRVFVHHERLRTVHPDGRVTPSVDERRSPDAIERGRAAD